MKKWLLAAMLLCLLGMTQVYAEEMEYGAETQYPNSLLFGLPNGPAGSCAILVDLPEDAVMVERVSFEDGDFIQTFQLPDGVTVQILRYATLDMTLEDMAEGEWTGYTLMEELPLDGLDQSIKKVIHLKTQADLGNGMAAYDVYILRAQTGNPEQAHLMQVVFPSTLGEERIHQLSKEMINSVLVYPLDLIEWG